MDVYPVGQSAYRQHIRAKIGQFGHETAANIFPVFRAVARAYHVDDVCPVQVGVSFVVKQQGSVVAFPQSRRIVRVVVAQAFDMVFPDKFKFFFSPCHLDFHLL